MGMTSFSIQKPVTTIMIFLGVCLFGVISMMKLPQELFPPIKYPQLTVFTSYANAAPEEVETLITRPIEEAVGTVSGLRSIRSISREGVSLVFAEFDWSQNMDFAALRMREKVDLVKARLPRDCSEPLVVPFNPFEMPVLRISVTGNRSPVDLRRISTTIIKEEIEKVDGVASASVEGGLEREIIIEADLRKLHDYQIPISDLTDVIMNENLNYPAGTIKESFYEYLIRTLGEFKEVKEINNLVVKDKTENPEEYLSGDERERYRGISRRPTVVRMKDVAEVKDTVKSRTSFSRYNGKENISISIQKQAQVNTIQVINRIKDAMGPIQKRLPADIQMKIIYDQSTYIKDAINGVVEAAWQGGVLAFLVLLMFLRNVYASLMVTVAIPISVIITFGFMYFGNITLNMMSLGGLSLGVGMLVDNGIVVIENIFSYREKGSNPQEAAIKGTDEVVSAVIGSTLTTIAVFFPMIFVIGVAGQLFKELAFTVTVSLLASLWVSFTLTPLMSSYMGKGKRKGKGPEVDFSGGKTWMKFVDGLEKILRWFLKKKERNLLCVLGILLASIFLTLLIEKEMMPKTDEGQFVIKIDMPVGTRVEETDRLALQIESRLKKEKDVESVSSIVGSTSESGSDSMVKQMGGHQGQIIVTLKEKRETKTVDVMSALSAEFKSARYSPAKIEVQMQQGMMGGSFGGGSKPVMIEVKGDNLKTMEDLANQVRDGLGGIKGVFSIEDDIPEASPEVRININKDKAAIYGLDVTEIAKTAQMLLRGYVPSKFKEKGKEYDIRVMLREKDKDSFNKLSRIEIESPTHGIIPMGMIVSFNKGLGPSEINRISQERTITIGANVADRKVSDVLKEVERVIKKIKIPSGYQVRIAGESEEMKKSFDSLRFALILSIVLVYMIMAAEFESITQPIIILTTIPLSLIGIFGALFLTGTSISVISLLGVIILGGVVVNNGIVLIEFINLMMRRGMNLVDAVVAASRARLRPILMTALTTLLGMLPMAFSGGKGSELRAPMAVSIIGGLTLSTILTLVVVPAIFILESEWRQKFKKSMGALGNKIKTYVSRFMPKNAEE